jgi:DNA-binding XRE family transcriptional regulator
VKTTKPLTGPGSRQPTLKLPTVMPDGSKTRMHPLSWCIQYLLIDTTKTSLAQHMGVKPQSLYKWERKCREDRHFPLPLLRAVQVADFFSVPVAMFRPDALPG